MWKPHANAWSTKITVGPVKSFAEISKSLDDLATITGHERNAWKEGHCRDELSKMHCLYLSSSPAKELCRFSSVPD